jgi:hypothetical protein
MSGWLCLLLVLAWIVFTAVWGVRAERENQRILESNKKALRWHGPSGGDVDDPGGDSGCGGGCGGCGD